MLNPSNLAKEIFGILRSFNYTVDIFDYDGNRVYEPADARRFFASPRNITVSINDDGENSSVKMFLSQSTSVTEVAGLIDTMRVTASKFGVLFNVRKYQRDLMPRDLSPNSGIEHETGVKLSHNRDTKTSDDLDAIKANITTLIDDLPEVMKKLKATKKQVKVEEGMTDNNDEKVPMRELPAFGCEVEVSAWNAFKNGTLETYNTPKEAETTTGKLRAVADVTKAEGLAKLFMIVADMLDHGNSSSLAKVVADKAIALGYNTQPEITDENKGGVQMTRLVKLGKVMPTGEEDENGRDIFKYFEVESSAWEDFDNGNLKLDGTIKFDQNFAKGANTKAFYLREIAAHCPSHNLALLFSYCADMIDAQFKGLTAEQKKLIILITNRAIAEAKKASGVMQESIIMTESIKDFGKWFDKFSSRAIFESDDYRYEPHDEAIHSAMHGDDTFDQAMDIAYDYVKDNFDAGDFLNTDGNQDFYYGVPGLTDEEKDITESDVKSSLANYIESSLEQALDGTTYPSKKDIDGLVDDFFPEVKEIMEKEGWTISSEVTESDMDQAKPVTEDDDELANEDVLLPVDGANDLVRDVSAKHAGTDNDRLLLLSKAIRGKY